LISKVASSVKKVVEPVANTLDKIGTVVFILMVCMLVYSVIVRKAGYPLKGVMELSEFGMVLVTFLFMSANYFKSDQMTMDTFVEKLPKKGCHIIGAFVHLVNFVILGLMSWRLFLQGSIVQGMGQTSTILAFPIFPFIYIAGACSVVLTAVYILHFLNSLIKVSEDWRT
jgi:TRAP-type C4-dicarboxylate transport system permease small subunit